MENLLAAYGPAITTFGVIGGLLLIQLLVADVLGIAAGHTPGTDIENDHDSLLFRATRAHANTNETIAAFAVLAIFGIAVSADPAWLNTLCLTYLVGRIGHMCCYYANLKIMRSIFFGISLIALFGILLAGWIKWLSS